VNSTIDKILAFSNNNTHNHESTTDHNLAVQCVRTAVKRKAEEDLHARPNKIIRKEIQDTNLVFKKVIVHNGGVRLRAPYLFRYAIARSARITKDKILITQRRTIAPEIGCDVAKCIT